LCTSACTRCAMLLKVRPACVLPACR
jgi:hypothetical protein